MLAYKRRKDPQAINRLEMLANWVSWHKSCLQTTCFQPDLCAIVPSSRGNPPNTELQKIAQLLSGAPLVDIQYAGKTPNQRSLQSEAYKLAQPVRNQRVVVVDDSWVTGASAVSVAQALLNAGALNVAIIVFARVLDRNWSANQNLIAKFRPTRRTVPLRFRNLPLYPPVMRRV